MATAPLAFPADAGNYTLLPSMSYGKIWKDSFQVQKFKKQFVTVAPITPEIMQAAYKHLENALQAPKAIMETGVKELLQQMCPDADCIPSSAVAYQIISDFYRQGRLEIEKRYVPGQTDALKAPKFYLSLKK